MRKCDEKTLISDFLLVFLKYYLLLQAFRFVFCCFLTYITQICCLNISNMEITNSVFLEFLSPNWFHSVWISIQANENYVDTLLESSRHKDWQETGKESNESLAGSKPGMQPLCGMHHNHINTTVLHYDAVLGIKIRDDTFTISSNSIWSKANMVCFCHVLTCHWWLHLGWGWGWSWRWKPLSDSGPLGHYCTETPGCPSLPS